MKRTTLAFILMVICTLTTSLSAIDTLYVDPAGSGSDGKSWENAHKTMKAAIDAVKNTNPVVIYLQEDAVFTENNLNTGLAGGDQTMAVNITLIGKNTTISSPASVNQRILRTEAANLTLKGITFQNVKNYGSPGGVIYFAGGNLSIDSCIFKDNSLSGNIGGAAIATGIIANMNVTIRNSLFQGNSAPVSSSSSGGLVIAHQGTSGSFVVENCTFRENIAGSIYGASAIGFTGTISNVTATITNNTFFNNTNASIPDGSIPNIYTIAGVTAYVVNNTFYFDKRDALTPEQELLSDSEKQKRIYRRNSAVHANKGTLHFINNVVSGMRNAIISGVAAAQTDITARNNYAVVVEPHANVPELPRTLDSENNPIADSNGNILICARATNTGDMNAANIAALDANLPIAGLATELSDDRFPSYLAITDEECPLVDAASYLYTDPAGIERVPLTDALGTVRGDNPDIGAFEYVTADEPTDPTGVETFASPDTLSVYGSDGVLHVVSVHSKALRQVSVYTLQGAWLVDVAPGVERADVPLPAGVYLVKVVTESSTLTAKVIIQ
jgi:hypothetical protein